MCVGCEIRLLTCALLFLTLASKCLALYAIFHEVKKAGVTYKTYLHTSKHTNYNVKGAIREIKTFLSRI